jgi:ribosomal protein S18 acetylase RimI-like enzyme
MAAGQLAAPSHLLPALTIHRVGDEATRADFSHIMSIAFGIPTPISYAIYGSGCTWADDFKGYVGYAEGLPVSSAATVVTGSVAGVYAVGTLPAYEHRGFAEAVMRHAIEQVAAPASIEYTVLQSSEAGFSLYRKMGYRAVTRYAVFAT